MVFLIFKILKILILKMVSKIWWFKYHGINHKMDFSGRAGGRQHVAAINQIDDNCLKHGIF